MRHFQNLRALLAWSARVANNRMGTRAATCKTGELAMAPRRRLLRASIGAGAMLASAVIGVSAAGIAKKGEPKAEVGSCAAYSGLPSEDGETAGMKFVPGGTFAMGSDQHQPEERFTHLARVDGFWTLAERPVDPRIHP